MKHYFPLYLPRGSKSAKYHPQIDPAHLFPVEGKLFISCQTFDMMAGHDLGAFTFFF